MDYAEVRWKLLEVRSILRGSAATFLRGNAV
jgi:hypothetical protein